MSSLISQESWKPSPDDSLLHTEYLLCAFHSDIWHPGLCFASQDDLLQGRNYDPHFTDEELNVAKWYKLFTSAVNSEARIKHYSIWNSFPHSSVGKESACNAGDPGSIPGSGRSAGKGIGYPLQYSWASLVAQLVKNLSAIQETWVWSLGWEDPEVL